MNSRIALLLVLTCLISAAQITERQQQLGRYFTPSTLLLRLSDAHTEERAMFYLEGVYDLTQDSGQSCAERGITTATLLEKIFSDYINAHPEVTKANRTAAGVAAQAFAQYWPCRKR